MGWKEQENIIVNQPKENGIKKVGMVGNHQGDEVYDPEGIAPALRDAGGQGRGALIQTPRIAPARVAKQLKRVTGNNKKSQRLMNVEIVAALKSTNQSNPRSGGTTLVGEKEIQTPRIAPTVRAEHHNTADVHFVASSPTNGTNMPHPSTEKGSGIKIVGNVGNGHEGKTTKIVDTGTNHQNSMKETSEQLTLLPYQTTISSVRDFLANLFLLLGSKADSAILEAHSSLKLCGSLGLKEPRIYSLRTSRDSSPTMGEKPLGQSFKRWMNLGMMSSGKCLTARISPSRRTGNEFSLSQILEKNPGPKYYLSEKQVKSLTTGIQESKLLEESKLLQHSNHPDTLAETTKE